MLNNQWQIIPENSIDGFQLGWSFDRLISQLDNNYNIDKQRYTWYIYYNQYRFGYDIEKEQISQILVSGNYQGKYLGRIGIGNTLEDVRREFGGWEDVYDTYRIPGVKGLCFELADVSLDEDDEWVEEKMPIRHIAVFTDDLE